MKFENCKVMKIFPVQSGVSKAGNNWSKQEILLELPVTNEQYPQGLIVYSMSEKVLNAIAQGTVKEEMKVDAVVDFRFPRDYKGKYYNDVALYSIAPSGAAPMPQQQVAAAQSYLQAASAPAINQQPDDLPF